MGGALGGGATDLSLLHPRARTRARPVRVAGRRPAALRLPPGRRRAVRRAGRLGGGVPPDDRRDRAAVGEYEEMLEQNPFFLMRTQGVGVISRELAETVGIGGPLLRGSGVAFDIRRAEPYSSYEDFDVPRARRHRRRLLRAISGADGGVPRVDHASSGRSWMACPRARSRRGPASSRWRRSGFRRARRTRASRARAAKWAAT